VLAVQGGFNLRPIAPPGQLPHRPQPLLVLRPMPLPPIIQPAERPAAPLPVAAQPLIVEELPVAAQPLIVEELPVAVQPLIVEELPMVENAIPRGHRGARRRGKFKI